MNIAVPGWSSIVFIFSLLFGILFILLGLIGEYIGRILIEVRFRPRFLISEEVGIKNTARDNFRWYQVKDNADITRQLG